MGLEYVKKASVNINDAMKKVNEHTVTELKPEDIYLFDIKLCNNDIDRVGDKMTNNFLEQIASNVSGLTGLKDHNWEMDNQISRLYDAEVVDELGEINKIGETSRYVLGHAYTLSKFGDYIDKINAGLIKECSIAFKSSGDKCSICGCQVEHRYDGIGVCENGHEALKEYDGKLCYTIIDKLEDTLEWSLVAVPCQQGAGVKNKSLGGSKMTKAQLFIKQFMASKAFKSADKAEREKLEQAVTTKSDEEVTEEEIMGIIDDNIRLGATVKELQQKLADEEYGRKRDRIEDIVSKRIDEMMPLTPKVKEMIMKDIPWDELDLEDGQIPGMDDVFAGIEKDYDGLFVNQSDVERRGGHKEPDGDEAGLVIESKEEPDGDEGKYMVVGKGCGSEKGIRPGVGNKKSSSNTKVKTGIMFH